MAKIRGTSRQISAARGDEEVDLLLKGGEIFSTTTKEWIRQDLAIKDGIVVGWGNRPALQEIDVTGCKLTPGFIDAHMHIESTKLWADEFVKVVLPRGTTAIAADPHELANVFGVPGVVELARATSELPFTFGICASSCVPASQYESPGATIGAQEIAALLEMDSVIGVAEVMNYPGVINADPEMLAKIAVAGATRVDGHAPGVRGTQLDAYLSAGVESDHECSDLAEAHEKRQKGMWIFLRQGSASQNISDLAPSIIDHGTSRAALCSDDREPTLLLTRGHMNDCLRVAVSAGITVEDALVMATLNPADYHGLHHLGSLGPGHQADVVVFRSLESFEPEVVLQRGVVVARNGEIVEGTVQPSTPPSWMMNSVHLKRSIESSDFDLRAPVDQAMRVIGVTERTLVTKSMTRTPSSCAPGSLARLSVIERHRATGRMGLGLVEGFGLRRGALASTVAHDAHNLMVVGGMESETDLEDMALAANTLASVGGGQVVCHNGKVLALVALPIAGLMSTNSAQETAHDLEAALEAASSLGVTLADPFMQLSFLGLSVIPELRLTDLGLIDVTTFTTTELFVGSSPQ
ncbi:MAG: adenine deaminase [Acidimicrobiales bacterium]